MVAVRCVLQYYRMSDAPGRLYCNVVVSCCGLVVVGLLVFFPLVLDWFACRGAGYSLPA